MLKMYVNADDGSDIVLFGLSAMNLVKLQENLPIGVDMRQFGSMQGHVVLGFRPNEELSLLHFTQPNGAPTTIVSLSAKALAHLQAGHMLDIDLTKTGRVGKLIVFYGTDEQKMMTDLRAAGIKFPAPASGGIQ